MFRRKNSGRVRVHIDTDAARQSRFEGLFDTYSGDMYRSACWICKDPSMAEELLQETSLRAWRSLDDLNDIGAVKGWLFAILRREFTRQFEKIRPVTEDIDNVPEIQIAVESAVSAETIHFRRARAAAPG